MPRPRLALLVLVPSLAACVDLRQRRVAGTDAPPPVPSAVPIAPAPNAPAPRTSDRGDRWMPPSPIGGLSPEVAPPPPPVPPAPPPPAPLPPPTPVPAPPGTPAPAPSK